MAQTLRDYLPGIRYNGDRALVVLDTDATHTLGAADSGKVYVSNAGSGTQTYTLPAVATAEGAQYTFVCGNAGTEILVNVQSGETIILTGGVAPAAGTGVKNTAATNTVGDSLSIVSDGTRWLSLNVGGTWASQ